MTDNSNTDSPKTTSADTDDQLTWLAKVAQSSIGMVIYAILVGVIVAVVADVYEIAFRFLARLWHENDFLSSHIPTWVRYLSGTFFACPILYILINQIPAKRQHNPADLIADIHINNAQINIKAALLSVLAAIFSIGFGFSVGYYAPIVVLGAAIGFLLHKLPWLSPRYAFISLGAGAAAAIAAIFHAPLGAVIFIHEVLFRFFSIRAFAPITIAAVSSYIVSSKLFDKATFLNVPTHYIASTMTYVVAAIGGVLAAVIGITMIRGISRLQQFNRTRQYGIMRQLLIAAGITAMIIVLLPEVAGSSLQAMQNVIISNQLTLGILALIFIGKLVATTVAFGFGVPGGIFGPTIFIGAALGGLIAGIFTWFFPDVIDAQQVIIITTMAAMISAVLGAPIAMIVIIIEMTGDFQIISVVMLSVVMANITAYRLMGTSSFFDIQLKSRGLDFEMGREQLYAEHHSITKLICDDYLAIDEHTALSEAEQILLDTHKNIAYVVDDENNLLGQIRMVEIRYYQLELHHTSRTDSDTDSNTDTDKPTIPTVMDILETDVTKIYRACSIWHAMEEITHNNVNFLPVVDGENNHKLLGVVNHNDLIAEYLKYVHQLKNQQNVSK